MANLPGRVRTDARKSGRIVEQIFSEAEADRPTRRCCLRFLANSIRYAAARWPDRWSVTLYHDYVRFNVGWVEALVLSPSGVGVMVNMSRPPRGVTWGRPYARAKGARLAWISFRDAQAVLPRLERAHRRAMDSAATWRTGKGTLAAHSPGVVDYLWQTLRLGNPPSRDGNHTREVALHILQGGIENGDKRRLEHAGDGQIFPHWTAPKSARIGDDAVIYISGHGLFATGKITSDPKPRPGWQNRYGAGVGSVRRIAPPISLDTLRSRLPELTWTIYPRSITTPTPIIGEKIRRLIEDRQRRRGTEIDEGELKDASLEELRAIAVARSAPLATAQQRIVMERKREQAIKRYAVGRAEGRCEFCHSHAPFKTDDGEPYLESHHILRLADDGPDDPMNVIGVCPNCHRRAHYAHDRKKIKRRMRTIVARLERDRSS